MRVHAPIALALALSASPALAGELPETAEITLWCGQAFAIVSEEIAGEEVEMAADLAARSAGLLAQARAHYDGAGIAADEAEKTFIAVKADVAKQIEGSGDDAKFTYDDCMALNP